MAGSRLNQSQQAQFDDYLAAKTGLSIVVIRAWRDAENGPAGNPLNIMAWSHGQRHVANFGNPQKAAQATVDQLRTPRYRGILQAAKHGSDADQLSAIAASPWEGNHYRGAGGSPGSLLKGTYKRETSGPSGPQGLAGKVTSVVDAPVNAVVGVASGGWLGGAENLGVKLLAYATLSGVAISLFVIGASRATGIVPSEFSAMRADKAGAVPF